jgi:hypothetical protein
MVTKKNNIANGGFILMARTETPGLSNWVVTTTGTVAQNTATLAKPGTDGEIGEGTDINQIKPCPIVESKNTGKCAVLGETFI